LTAHPRNRHQGRYDIAALVRTHPGLAPFVIATARGQKSVDFTDPHAVKALNAALLAHWYGVRGWDVPEGFLCPPIPGRADYLHHLADLLATGDGSIGDRSIPRGAQVRVLDIGVGANGVYPLIGHGEYGWSFVGSDILPVALESVRGILAHNPAMAAITLRLQESPARVLVGVIQGDEVFDAILCNPPFHTTAAEAQAASERKWSTLAKAGAPGRRPAPAPLRNFAGQAAELWCQGGEVGFIGRMIDESRRFRRSCAWFTTLIAHAEHVAELEQAARKAGAVTVRVIAMAHGQKRSRLLAWTFLTPSDLRAWRQRRWKTA
jgi:23S rRNA (adenine1618-N6)-methyltransferase